MNDGSALLFSQRVHSPELNEALLVELSPDRHVQCQITLAERQNNTPQVIRRAKCRCTRSVGGWDRCDRTRCVKYPKLCVLTVETRCPESVSHLGFQLVVQQRAKKKISSVVPLMWHSHPSFSSRHLVVELLRQSFVLHDQQEQKIGLFSLFSLYLHWLNGNKALVSGNLIKCFIFERSLMEPLWSGRNIWK